MTAVGYGFSRPMAPNDPIKGNPVNRRVEVYIRPSGHKRAETSTVPAFQVILPPKAATTNTTAGVSAP